MKEEDNPNIDEKGDFIFRWELEEAGPTGKTGRGALKNFIQMTLAELLNITALTYKGEDVKIDGFRFLNEAKINKIFNQK